ncbi:MAG TPA: UDP-N-acetylmuramoyl-L-alanine--D-glutamate ligase, partial [Thermoanaerobaculia bacterium]|nr:UDP-N-acetylmuramoyl-L-alanine--D-glutamate ligase [Thermoanaerobaculia bacterium]
DGSSQSNEAMENVLIIGAGKSGVAAANFLARHGIRASLSDSNDSPHLPYALDPNVTTQFGRQDDALLDGIDTVVLSPGVPATIPLVATARARAIPVIAEVELAYRQLRGTVIAITGSNGKSTTTALIGEILRVAGLAPIVAGNIGEPLIGVADPAQPRTYVVELSSYQLETVDQFHAGVALLLNVTPDHMDRYPSLDAYAAAKFRVFRNQQSGDVAIINANERREVSEVPGRRIWRFSAWLRQDEGAFLDDRDLVIRVEGREHRIPRAALRLDGLPNVENALAAWLAARAIGVDDRAVETAFRAFAGLPHRMVLVRERHGVRWVNDSKGTNVDATLKSLEGFPDESVILILGGKDKAGEFERMRPLVAAKTRAVLTIGAAAARIANALDGAAVIVPAGDMDTAVRWAAGNGKPGDTVLLSPACASFDQYRNFEHRGEHFEELVHAV